MKKNTKLKNTIFQLSALLILLAAIIYYFNADIGKYAMVVGVIGYAITTFKTPYPGKNVRGKRLHNIQIFGVLFMVVSAYLMFADMKQWPLTLCIAAVLTLYSSIILPKVYENENNENNNSDPK